MTSKCPHCGSPKPHLHPAVQLEGEVEICTHDFHLTPTNATSSPGAIKAVLEKRARQAAERGQTV